MYFLLIACLLLSISTNHFAIQTGTCWQTRLIPSCRDKGLVPGIDRGLRDWVKIRRHRRTSKWRFDTKQGPCNISIAREDNSLRPSSSTWTMLGRHWISRQLVFQLGLHQSVHAGAKTCLNIFGSRNARLFTEYLKIWTVLDMSSQCFMKLKPKPFRCPLWDKSCEPHQIFQRWDAWPIAQNHLIDFFLEIKTQKIQKTK